MVIELERTYLLRTIPDDILNAPCEEYLDIYLPTNAIHPSFRIRKRGLFYEMTKKSPINSNDHSKQAENTISLTKNEFTELEQCLKGKRIYKTRYFYKNKNIVSEIDIFQDNLLGLAVVDFEFTTEKLKNSFEMPDFCLAEITQDENLAGGMISGKKYSEIELILAKYNYKPLIQP